MDCDEPVEGTVGKALRCAEHKRRARLDQGNAHRRTDQGRAAQRIRDRERRSSETRREKRNARRRQLHAARMKSDPEYRERYRRRRQEETSINHPGYQRRIEYFRRNNKNPKRAKRKREHARRRYYELHPERPDPHCATCGEPIPYGGCGAPPKYHQTVECNPYISPAD